MDIFRQNTTTMTQRHILLNVEQFFFPGLRGMQIPTKGCGLFACFTAAVEIL
jgi:hypothetical protein